MSANGLWVDLMGFAEHQFRVPSAEDSAGKLGIFSPHPTQTAHGRVFNMPSRPFWSGQLKISLVSFGIHLFPATDSRAGVSFHQIDRKSGQRIHHLNVVNGDRKVDTDEIAKGYEYSKGKYLLIEPEEIAKLRIETRKTLELRQFAKLSDLSPALFEHPYFVVPQGKEAAGAFAVIRKALGDTEKAGLGEIAFAGREHLVAIAAPADPTGRGLMAYVLRYEEELRRPKDYFDQIPKVDVDRSQLKLATDLIQSNSKPLKLNEFKDDYEAALHALIAAKRRNRPLQVEEEPADDGKVINLMDALRKSVESSRSVTTRSGTQRRKSSSKAGPVLVKPPKRRKRVA